MSAARGDSFRGDDQRSQRSSSSIVEIENVDRTVHVANLPGEKFTNEELVDFFKPYGKISDIRVFKDHLLVQYHRVDQAKKLIEEGQRTLIFGSHRLEISSAKDCQSSKRRSSHRSDEPNRKRFLSRDSSDSHQRSSRVCDHRHRYSILSGPKDPAELVDCQILLVNIRQRIYADQIECRLISSGLRTSTRLLREDFPLTEAIQLASEERCLYAIVVMPMHEERRTASFHILYGQTEEHRNLTLEDGFHILLTNYLSYKERLRQLELNPSREIGKSQEESPREECSPLLNVNVVESVVDSLPSLSLSARFPLSMLLCLLADGRQLTLDEIDRVLVYLLEKKAKMLTLPSGTLPPLPVQYVTSNNNHSSEGNASSNCSGKMPTKVENCLSSSLAEQIRQILSTSVVVPPPSSSSLGSSLGHENPSATNSMKMEESSSTSSSFKCPPLSQNSTYLYSPLPPSDLYSLSLTDPIYHSFPLLSSSTVHPKQEK